ncbi:MAG: tripartite tricarboxylate transporter substrate binding protein [Mitsuaria chitosanitabida]|uniref:tripartite tricarboxylate transporter substrate binding protein n=1 Tax=Roseateles chitosanitabidus TaxID=65048 RepID=UPI001B266C35|nr:tripartite tricarboxylate transporter substrate binding protein [Roseateles chitosanitabidus]MBO9686416.1 tripartite tricarboxylate transporter substrate binding protein [Roseateles chitosanitabidus]
MIRRTLIAGLATATVSASALAQGYPDHPVRLIVPYAPGGSADIVARLISDEWGKALGKPLVVENKAGAGGNLGVAEVAKAAGDGYTVGLQTVSLAINPALTPKMPYDTLKDLAPVGMVASSQHVLVVNENVPAKTVKDLVALAKRQPGKLSYASAGTGSTFHMAAELFKAVAGVSIVHIPYRGGGPALSDTIGGQTEMAFPVLSAAQGHVQSGRLRALGVTGPRRSPLMPNVPTIAEAGVPGYSFETWFMVFVPSGTPKPVVDRLNATLNAVLATPTVKDRMAKEGFDASPSTPAAARARLEKELPQWAKLVKERGITAD